MARILVVDDEELVRFTLQDLLEAAGHDVVVASNGAEAVDLQNAQSFDLVITDIIMPEKEGVQTIIELKRQHPELKVIAISGGGRTRNLDFLEVAKQFGADKLLAKPFAEEELLESIAACLSEGN